MLLHYSGYKLIACDDLQEKRKKILKFTFLKVIFSGEMELVLMDREVELEDGRETEALNAAAILGL